MKKIFLFILLFPFILYFPYFTYQPTATKLFVVSIFFITLFLILSLKYIRTKGKIKIYSPFIFILIFGIYSIFSTFFSLFYLPEIFLSIFSNSVIFFIFILYSIYISNTSIEKSSFILQITIIAGLIISIDSLSAFYFGFSFLTINNTAPFNRGSIKSVIGNINFVTDFMAILLPISLYLSITNKQIWKKDKFRSIFFGLIYLIFLSVIFIGQTRGVYLSLIISIIFLIIFFLIIYLKRKISIFKYIKAKLLLILIIFSVILFVGFSTNNFLTGGGKINISERITKELQNTVPYDERFKIWKGTLNLWKKSPVLGNGFNTFKYLISEGIAEVNSDDPDLIWVSNNLHERAHQDYLQTLSETGIIGISLIIILFFISIIYLFKFLQKEKDVNKIIYFFFLCSSIVVVCSHSFVSFPFHIMPNNFLVTIILGIIFSKDFIEDKFKHIKIKYSVAFPLFVISLCILNLFLSSKIFLSDGYFSKARSYKALADELTEERAQTNKKINDEIEKDNSNEEEISKYTIDLVLSTINVSNSLQRGQYFNGLSLDNLAFYNNLVLESNLLNFPEELIYNKGLIEDSKNPKGKLIDFYNSSIKNKNISEEFNPREIVKPLYKNKISMNFFVDLIDAIPNELLIKNKKLDLIEAFLKLKYLYEQIDILIYSQQFIPDGNIFYNIGNKLYSTFSEIKKIQQFLLEESLENKKNLSLDMFEINYRFQFEYAYDTAIYLMPSKNFYYKDYAKQLSELYGLDSIKKLLEVGNQELYNWSYIKEKTFWIPDNAFNVLCALYSDIPESEKQMYITKLLDMYEDAYNWSKEKIDQCEIEEISLDYENFNRLKETIKRYEELKGLEKGGTD